MTDLITLTRYYGSDDHDLQRLERFIVQAQSYSREILIAVHVEKDFSKCLEKLPERFSSSTVPVRFISIQPWIGISSPLNILLNHLPLTEEYVLIQSIEIQSTVADVQRLRSYLNDPNVLCVGAALDGHQLLTTDRSVRSVLLPLRGDTSPWNTFIIWNLSKLRRTGFPLCSDFVRPAGMEDAAAIALQQQCFGGREKNRALLVRWTSNVQWLTNFDHDHERLCKHQMKMKSKNNRTEEQLRMLNISSKDEEERLGVEYIHQDESE